MALNIISPDAWNPSVTGNFAISLGTELFEFQSARKPWSISVPTANAIRFELRDGDQHWWDALNGRTSERNEFTDRNTITNGTPLHIGYDFTLDPGAKNTAAWMVLGQLHQNDYAGAQPWSPPFAIALEGEKMAIDVRYSGPDGEPVAKRLFTDVADIQRGHKYDIDVSAVFDPAGNGRLVVTRDGVTIADYSGPLGYTQQQGVYWAEGIYRDGKATETVVATYANLVVETGNSVKIPGSNEYIAAPDLRLDKLSDAANGTRVAALSGAAKVGTTVTISENGKVTGTARTDADGKFHLNVTVKGDGGHSLSAVATNKDGRDGVTRAPLKIDISTAADIVARMDTLASDGGIAKIVLTDTHLLQLDSKTQLSKFLSYSSTLAKIEGDVTFIVRYAVTGQSYNRQDEIYSSKGIVLERLRYSGSKLTYDETISSDGHSSVKNYNSNGTMTLTEAFNGKTLSSAQVNAAGIITLKNIFNPDGSKEVDYFNPTTGAKANSSLYKTDGTRVDTYFGITGKDYTSQVYTYDKAGRNTLLERYSDNGTKLYAKSWLPNGTVETHNYAPNGKETSFLIVSSDGSRSEGAFGVTGQSYSAQVSHYNKSNVLTSRERYDDAGHIKTLETFGTGASVKTYAYDASTGALSGWTVTAADKSYAVYKLYSGSETKVSKVVFYDKAGAVLKSEYYDTSGTKIGAPDTGGIGAGAGSAVTYAVDSVTGLKTGMTVKAVDGSLSVVKFAAGSESVYQSVDKYSANGKLVGTDLYDSAGRLSQRTTVGDNGTTKIDRLDAAGKVLSQTYIHDGIREEHAYAVAGKSYTQQNAVYDGNDKLVSMERLYANGKPAFEQAVNGDGTQIVKEWTTSGLLTVSLIGSNGKLQTVSRFDVAGREVSSEDRHPDGTRVTHIFDVNTGEELTSLTINADKSRVEANYAVVGKDYAQQIATYDAAGRMVQMVRKHDDAGHTLAFLQKINPDGSSEVHNYDMSGRETVRILTNDDGSRDAFAFAYANTSGFRALAVSSDPTTSRQDHFGANGQKQWTDVTNADGSHTQTAYVAGTKLSSTAGASDTFTATKAGTDTFVFKPDVGKDTILGFVAGNGAGHDVVAFDDSIVSDYAHLSSMMSKVGSDTLITVDAGDTILIKNVAPASLTSDNFKFLHHADLLA